MEKEDIKQLSTKELIERIKDEKDHLVKLKISHAVSPIENPLRIRSYRRTIAKMETELRKRELEEQLNN